MSFLSRPLGGLLLHHAHFGNHLNSQGKTIDSELELKNFEHAGQALAEIWNDMKIDDYPVKAEYKNPEKVIDTFGEIESEWYSNHVRESQYLLQVHFLLETFFLI